MKNIIEAALSADVVLQNLYVFGLVADISSKLKEYKDENNLMLLADAPKFLNGVIQDSDTPFIYEKVGSFYKNYLIDEFQDTSAMQWKNFLAIAHQQSGSGLHQPGGWRCEASNLPLAWRRPEIASAGS